MAQAILDRVDTRSNSLTPLERVQALIRDPQPVTIVTKAAQAKAAQAKLFGIEQQVHVELNQVIQAEESQRLQVAINRFAAMKQVGILDNSVLDWRDQDGMPLLVPFSLESPEFGIHTEPPYIHNSRVRWGTNSVPTFISQHYQDVFDKLLRPVGRLFFGHPVNWSPGSSTVFALLSLAAFMTSLVAWATSLPVGIGTFNSPILMGIGLLFVLTVQMWQLSKGREYHSHKTTVFNGMIPDDARELISSKVTDFDGIIILAEAKSWATQITVLPRVDPLILGHKYDQLFYIGKFDPVSPIESFVAQEFVIKPS